MTGMEWALVGRQIFLFRVTKLENAMREKERVIEEMTVEKRNLEKIKRDQEKQIEVLKNERDYITRVEATSKQDLK